MSSKMRQVSFLIAFLTSLVMPSLSWSATGLELTISKPKFSNGQNRSYFTDMKLQYEAGQLEFTRRWNGSRWVFNPRWDRLLLIHNDDLSLPADVNKLTDEQILQMTEGEGLPKYILRDGEAFAGVSYQVATARYEHFQQHSISPVFDDIEAEEPQITGYTWESLKGNQMGYDPSGRIQWMGAAAKPKVYFEYNEVNDIRFIKDSQGQTLLTLTYEDIPSNEKTDFDRSNYRLKQIQDYSGRSVIYDYELGTGKIIAVTDVRGFSWTMLYSDHHFDGYIDPEGRKTTVDIDLEGRLLSYKNSDGVGETYRYSYDKATELFIVQVTDNSGTTVENLYDYTGRSVQSSVNGVVTNLQYQATYSDGSAVSGTAQMATQYRRVWVSGIGECEGELIDEGQGQLTSNCVPPYVRLYIKERRYRNELGNEITYAYNATKELTSQQNPDGTMESYDYKDFPGFGRRLVSRTTASGVIYNYNYDDKAQLIEEIEAVGSDVERRTLYSYNELGQLIKIIYRGGDGDEDAVWQGEYDSFGNIIKGIDPYGKETIYSDVDGLGNAHTITDANENVRTRSYDALGNLLTDFNPYGQGRAFSYDKTGFAVTSASSKGGGYQLAVNANGFPVEIKDSLNYSEYLNYDLDNRPTVRQDGSGNISRFAYDERGRIAELEDGEGYKTKVSYSGDNLSQVETPNYQTQYQYDDGDRLVEILQVAGELNYRNTRVYNIPGRSEASTDANGHGRSILYDELNRVKVVTDAEGKQTQFSYDYRDNLLQVIDPEGRETLYTYNLRNKLLSETKHLQQGSGNHQAYSYDAVGLRVRHRNAKGEVILYGYDQANRLTQLQTFLTEAAADAYLADNSSSSPVRDLIFNYTTNNQLAGYSDSNSGETRTYNSRGELETVTVNFGNFSKTYQYTYTPNGLIQSYTSPEGQLYTYSYNKSNLITSVVIEGQGVINWGDYDWTEATTVTLPGGSTLSYGFDGLLRVNSRSLIDPAKQSLSNANYSYDGEDNITHIATELGEYSFEYDPENRLTSNLTPFENQQYQYDGVGNRLTLTNTDSGQDPEIAVIDGSYDDNNQLNVYDNASYLYDDNGHTIERVDVVGTDIRKTQYLYNIEQRLVEVKIATVDSGLSAEALAEKTAQELQMLASPIITDTVATYVYDANGQRIKKLTQAGTVYYLYSQQGLAAEYDDQGNLIVAYQYKPQSSWMTNPVVQNRSGIFYYYQNDHLGTPQRLLKTNGEIVWRANYKTFGELDIVVNAVNNNIRFSGQYYDEESGLHYNYFRDYDPSTGRYLQSDPIGLRGGINTYVYVNGNPLIWFDPFGLAAKNWEGGTPLPGNPEVISPPHYDPDPSQSNNYDDGTLEGHESYQGNVTCVLQCPGGERQEFSLPTPAWSPNDPFFNGEFSNYDFSDDFKKNWDPEDFLKCPK